MSKSGVFKYFYQQEEWDALQYKLEVKATVLGFDIGFSSKTRTAFTNFEKGKIFVSREYDSEVLDKYILALATEIGRFECNHFILAKRPYRLKGLIWRKCRIKSQKRQDREAWRWAENFIKKGFSKPYPRVIDQFKKIYFEEKPC